MSYASKTVVRTWLFITVISVVAVCVFGDKRFDLKIGFDITNGEDGGPSLKIRDFEDSLEVRPRAKADPEEDATKPTVRADTSSESDDDDGNIKRKGKNSSVDKSENDDDDSSSDNRRSTRGLKQGDYEPEENVKIHNYRGDPSDNDSDRFRRRKRSAYFRRKGKP